ncbi:transcription factor, putative [Ricinus communis]|uniref:Transcription factor, putative n=1 Tax=Ricinus communis TaxID=3988 RepID=B9SE72_RICCO|nr:transcription factor, putative [Ricinus communis]
MASSKVMASSKPKSSDLTAPTTRSRRPSSSSSSDQVKNLSYNFNSTTTAASLVTPSSSTMTVDGIIRSSNNNNSNIYSTPAPIPTTADSTLLDAQITLIDNPTPPPPPQMETSTAAISQSNKTVDDVWREIVSGRKEMKEEQPDEMMTLEDFLAKAGAVDVVEDEDLDDEVKMPLPLPSPLSSGGMYAFDSPVSVPQASNAFQILDKVEGSIVAFGNGGNTGGGGRGKRGRSVVMEPLDKAAQQRQRRMIKNRESAARSRERKQAYQVELESLAVRLEEENEQMLKEKVNLNSFNCFRD